MGLPGIGLVWGPTGYGKTTAVTWYVNQCHGVYVRAMATWSPNAMLRAILQELNLEPRGSNALMVEAVIEGLAREDRPLFVDEADYVVERKLLTDTLRDVHDLSVVPVVLIGMHGIEKRIRSNPQFTGRVSQWVEFSGADLSDARLLANGLAEVAIDDALLGKLHAAASPKGKNAGAGAEIRRMVVGLSQIEGYARACGLDALGVKDWPAGRDFFMGSPTRVER
jgi:DNA transposition AAA+ family ATPase